MTTTSASNGGVRDVRVRADPKSPTRHVLVSGTLPHGGGTDGGVLHFIAAAPYERRFSFAGSGLPFVNMRQAFHNTPNRGTARVQPDGRFDLRLETPGAYYVGVGTVLVTPTASVSYVHNGREERHEVPLPADATLVPYRTLTHPPERTGAMFYAVPRKYARSQEQILRESAFPEYPGARTPTAPAAQQSPAQRFWGGKPPV